MSNPYLDDTPEPVRRRSIRHEKRTAKRAGGRARPGSGCCVFGRGDLVVPGFLGEHKFLSPHLGAFVLQRGYLIKITREARIEGVGTQPFFVVTYEAMDLIGVDPDWLFEPLENSRLKCSPSDLLTDEVPQGQKSRRISREFVAAAWARDPRAFAVIFDDMLSGISKVWIARPLGDWGEERGVNIRNYRLPSTGR